MPLQKACKSHSNNTSPKRPSLKGYYAYWDRFVHEWSTFINSRHCINHAVSPCKNWSNHANACYGILTGWKYPNFNNSESKNSSGPVPDPTILYIPQPWGGNDGTKPLQSVVINYNPGVGLPKQKRVRIKSFTQYYHIDKGVETENYIYKNRAKPIFDTLTILGENLNGHDRLENHLSIELIPWHSKDWHLASNYARQNAAAIFEHCIKFAADASRCIENNWLENIVLVRMSYPEFKKVFKNNKNFTELIGISNKIDGVALDNSKYSVIKFDNIDNVKFIFIWQSCQPSPNNFPHCLDFIKIIKYIPKFKLIK